MITKASSRLSVLIAILCLVTLQNAVSGGDKDVVYYSTDLFEVTDFDLKMYLRNAPDLKEGDIGSRARNLQALSDLYAMQVLVSDAQEHTLLTEEERQWIANYEVAIETINRYLSSQVALRLAQTDWESEALERYLSNPQQFEIPEKVTLRTLLIRTGDRSEEEAMVRANELLRQAIVPGSDFAELVRVHTEDKSAIESGGLMEGITRGKTVKPFEDAAFALRTPGELSEPVVTQFGVHLIELVEYVPPRTRTFDESKEQIIADLKPLRAAQYREAIQTEARERKLEGFLEHTEALDTLVEQTSDGRLGRNN